MYSFDDVQLSFCLFSFIVFIENDLKIICCFFVLVPVTNGNEDSRNTFLSSSLQKTPSTDGSSKEETPVKKETNELKENLNRSTSKNILDEERSESEQNKQLTPDVSEEKREETSPGTLSSALNPEANAFVILPTTKIESAQSISTGDESDDENEPSDTPVSTGK